MMTKQAEMQQLMRNISRNLEKHPLVVEIKVCKCMEKVQREFMMINEGKKGALQVQHKHNPEPRFKPEEA